MIPFRYTTGNIVVASTPVDQLGDVFTLLSQGEKEVIFFKAGYAITSSDLPADATLSGVQQDGSIV